MALTAVPNLADLVVDYTIDPVGAGGGSDVAQTHVIAGTVPIEINGAASSDMTTSPTTISVLPFTPTEPGVVPLSGGGTANFLRADGTWTTYVLFDATHAGIVPMTGGVGAGFYLDATGAWVAGTIVGVSSVTGTSPIVVAPTSGAVVVSVHSADILTSGVVPATGGANAAKFLCATNPLSWAVPGIGQFINLQGAFPGTTDTGNGHISGIFEADWRLVGGPGYAGLAPVESFSDGPIFGNVSDYCGYFARLANSGGGVPINASPILKQERARGTLSAPTPTGDNDWLGGFCGTGYNLNNLYDGSLLSGVVVKADGAASAAEQPSYMDSLAGELAEYAHIRQSKDGVRFESKLTTGPSDAARALHTVDVQGTFGIKPKLFNVPGGGGVYSYVIVDEDPSVHIIDQGARDTQVTLPSAVGRDGRRYTIISADDAFQILVQGTGGETINGLASYVIQRIGDSLTIISDGSNWWTESHPVSEDLSNSISSTFVVADTAVETTIVSITQPFGHYELPGTGAVYKIRMGGKFSTTGTPTLQFKIKNSGGTTMCDSGAIVCPAGVTDQPWYIEFESIITDPSVSYAGRILRAALHLGGGTAGLVSEYTMMIYFTNPANGVLPFGVTAQWGAADPANTLTRTAMVTGMTPHTLTVA